MFGEYMKAQGTVIPTFFIGLGGVGSRIVDHIAGRASSLPNWAAQLQGLTSFVCIDTNILDLNSLKNVPQGSRIHIGAVDKRKLTENYRASGNMQALQWIDKNYQPREGVKPGAGQIRVESRLGYHYASPGIRLKLDQLVRHTLDANNNWRQNNPRYYYVYLYCSVAGGTGSGSFLPVAYLINDLLIAQGWQPRVIGNLVLSTLLTQKVAPDLHPNIHANTYAALKELEHLMKLNYKSVKLERADGEPFVFWNNENSDEIARVRYSPFFHCFLFDRPVETNIGEPETAIGDASFLQVFTPIIDLLAGEYDNYEQHNQALTHLPGENKSLGQGYTKNFGAFGTSALILPAGDLLEYCALRFGAEALRRQITFGSGSKSSTERERALDRLKVNYDDPAFRNLDESSRYERINQSFLLCVQAMADFDAKEEQKGGYWYRLVEDVDQGQEKGTDKDGKLIRTETLKERVFRTLDETRKPSLDQVSIKNRAFVFTREGANQYSELLTKFKEDIRVSTVHIEGAKEKLKAAASEGDAISALSPRPTPMQERYLMIQLLGALDTKLIPEARDQFEKAKAKAFTNPKIQERLERELPANLSEAAQAKGRFGIGWDVDGFEAVRNSAQTEFQEVARSQTRYFDAELKLSQYQALRDYLSRRARQYAMLALRMNDLVLELEAEAESLRSGVSARQPSFALSVEVFQTLAKPRKRLWSQVYDELFVNAGKDLSTFDRETIARTISAQLEPVKDPQTGRFVEKNEYTIVADLRLAVVALGRERLRREIFGDQDKRGLTLEKALEIEARLTLPPRNGRPLEEREILDYAAEKFKAVHLMAALIARTKTDEMRSLDTGVKLARKRHFLMRRDSVSDVFYARFSDALTKTGFDLARGEIANPHIAIVHDAELPIPLFFFDAITGELEQAYEKVMANEQRAFNLHIDYNWEHSLPNLNPKEAEISITWSLEVLLDGILTKAFVSSGGQWVWQRTSAEAEALGTNLAAALYTVVDLYDDNVLGPRLKAAIAELKTKIGDKDLLNRATSLKSKIGETLEDIAIRGRRQQKTRDDDLDLPILRALERLCERRLGAGLKRSDDQAFAQPQGSASLSKLDF